MKLLKSIFNRFFDSYEIKIISSYPERIDLSVFAETFKLGKIEIPKDWVTIL